MTTENKLMELLKTAKPCYNCGGTQLQLLTQFSTRFEYQVQCVCGGRSCWEGSPQIAVEKWNKKLRTKLNPPDYDSDMMEGLGVHLVESIVPKTKAAIRGKREALLQMADGAMAAQLQEAERLGVKTSDISMTGKFTYNVEHQAWELHGLAFSSKLTLLDNEDTTTVKWDLGGEAEK